MKNSFLCVLIITIGLSLQVHSNDRNYWGFKKYRRGNSDIKRTVSFIDNPRNDSRAVCLAKPQRGYKIPRWLQRIKL